MIDVGAAGKGYLVDLVCDILRHEGLTEFAVDASGDLRREVAIRCASAWSTHMTRRAWLGCVI